MTLTQKHLLNMASSDSQIDKSQHGHLKRAELPDVNINTGEQSNLILMRELLSNSKRNAYYKCSDTATAEH